MSKETARELMEQLAQLKMRKSLAATPMPELAAKLTHLQPGCAYPIQHEPLQGAVEEMGADIACLANQLKALLECMRVRTIGGFMRDRCQACNVPHPYWKKCTCPHHRAMELLKRFGVEVEA